MNEKINNKNITFLPIYTFVKEKIKKNIGRKKNIDNIE